MFTELIKTLLQVALMLPPPSSSQSSSTQPSSSQPSSTQPSSTMHTLQVLDEQEESLLQQLLQSEARLEEEGRRRRQILDSLLQLREVRKLQRNSV